MHAVAVPKGVCWSCCRAAPLYPMLYFLFYAGGRAHMIRWAGFCLLPSTTWGQGRQPSSSPAVSVSASSAPVTSSSRDLRAAARRLC